MPVLINTFFMVQQVGGVRTNFRMPDVNSIGLGGGSLVKCRNVGLGCVISMFNWNKCVLFVYNNIAVAQCEC